MSDNPSKLLMNRESTEFLCTVSVSYVQRRNKVAVVDSSATKFI
jgi:hypothetical protein